MLLERGAEVEVGHKDHGATPLFMAADRGRTEVVRLLLEAKADVHAAADASGTVDTPLSRAKRFGHAEIIELLLEAGAKD